MPIFFSITVKVISLAYHQQPPRPEVIITTLGSMLHHQKDARTFWSQPIADTCSSVRLMSPRRAGMHSPKSMRNSRVRRHYTCQAKCERAVMLRHSQIAGRIPRLRGDHWDRQRIATPIPRLEV